MRTVALLALLLLPMGDIFGQTFGLGPDRVEMSAAVDSGETFGLSGETYKPAAVAKAVVPVVKTVAPKPNTVVLAAPYSSPPGYHRHVMVDGSIIEHGDWNYGDPVAHAGVSGAGWPKYYGPLAPSSTVGTVIQASNCPGGVCPTTTTVRRGFFRRR